MERPFVRKLNRELPNLALPLVDRNFQRAVPTLRGPDEAVLLEALFGIDRPRDRTQARLFTEELRKLTSRVSERRRKVRKGVAHS